MLLWNDEYDKIKGKQAKLAVKLVAKLAPEQFTEAVDKSDFKTRKKIAEKMKPNKQKTFTAGKRMITFDPEGK